MTGQGLQSKQLLLPSKCLAKRLSKRLCMQFWAIARAMTRPFTCQAIIWPFASLAIASFYVYSLIYIFNLLRQLICMCMLAACLKRYLWSLACLRYTKHFMADAAHLGHISLFEAGKWTLVCVPMQHYFKWLTSFSEYQYNYDQMKLIWFTPNKTPLQLTLCCLVYIQK